MTREERTAHAKAQAERRKLIVNQFYTAIKGTPMNEEHPHGEMWLVAVFSAFGLAMLAVGVVA